MTKSPPLPKKKEKKIMKNKKKEKNLKI